MPVGLDNIVIPSAAAREQTHRVANQGGGGVDSTGRKWKIGELEFEALMRTLDNSVSCQVVIKCIAVNKIFFFF